MAVRSARCAWSPRSSASRASPTRAARTAERGGALLDLGVYPLALASQLLGRPVEVASEATLGATGVDEQSALLLRYDGSRIASLGASLRNLALNEAYIAGSTGQIRMHGPLNQPQALTVTPAPNVPPPEASRLLDRLRRQPALGSLAARLAHHRRQVRPRRRAHPCTPRSPATASTTRPPRRCTACAPASRRARRCRSTSRSRSSRRWTPLVASGGSSTRRSAAASRRRRQPTERGGYARPRRACESAT